MVSMNKVNDGPIVLYDFLNERTHPKKNSLLFVMLTFFTYWPFLFYHGVFYLSVPDWTDAYFWASYNYNYKFIYLFIYSFLLHLLQ